MGKKKKKLTDAERKERQRQWAIKRKYEIRDFLLKLGHSFDSRQKGLDDIPD